MNIVGTLLATCLALSCAVAPATASEPASSARTFLVLYSPGPAWVAGKPIREQPPKAHGRYLLDLYEQGKLTSAGPFDDDSGAALVLTVADADEAEALIAADPAVADGVFRYRIHPWAPVPWQQYLRK